MKKDRFSKIFMIVALEILLIMAVISGIVNWFRIYNMQKPVFTIPINVDENGEGTYYGLGYAIKVDGRINKYTKEYEQIRTDYYVLGILVSSLDHLNDYE